jgi:hypothetical protein
MTMASTREECDLACQIFVEEKTESDPSRATDTNIPFNH